MHYLSIFIGLLGLCTTGRAVVCTNTGKLDTSNGGRKIAFVIDNSGSMVDFDPNDIRLVTAKLINDNLVSPATATSEKRPDEAAVVKFSESAELLYPLGDPSGAGPKIDEITFPDGGTSISDGIKVALDELSKSGESSLSEKAGIVVFTDGLPDNGIPEDYPKLVEETVSQIERAGRLGVRVSFAFLRVADVDQEPGILLALVKTGGTPGILSDADSVSRVTELFIDNGLVGKSNPEAKVHAVPDVSIVSVLDKTGPNTFTYAAKAGETFNITAKGIYETIPIKLTLRDGGEVKATGGDFVEYTAEKDTEVEVVVETEDGSLAGLFELLLRSTRDPCEIEQPTTETPDTSTRDTEPTATQGSSAPSVVPTLAPTHTKTTPTQSIATVPQAAGVKTAFDPVLMGACLLTFGWWVAF